MGAQTIRDSLGRDRENFDLMRLRGTATETNFLDYLGHKYGLQFEPIVGDTRLQDAPVRPTSTPVRQPAATPAAWEEARSMMLPRTRALVEDWIRTGEPLERYTRRVLADIQKREGIQGTLDEWLARLKRDFESRAAGVR